jgi:hypothetical protein
VAVFQLTANTGVDRSTADVLTDLLVEEIRKPNVFGRVVSARELEELISFEKQRELAGCTQQSCMAELAGALGVEFIVIGGVAKIGRSAILSVKLIDVKLAVTRASLAQQMCAQSDETLLKALRPAVRGLLIQGSLLSPSMALPVPAEECGPTPPPSAASTPDTPTSMKDGGLGKRLMVGGGIAASVGAIAAAATAALAVATLVWFAALRFSPTFAHSLRPLGLGVEERATTMWGAGFALAAAGFLAGVVGVALMGGGGAAALGGVVYGS